MYPLGALAQSRAPVATQSETEARAGVGRSAPNPSLALGLEGFAYVTGLPTQDDRDARLAGNEAVSSVFAEVDALGLVQLGSANTGSESSELRQYSNYVEFNLSLAAFAPSDILNLVFGFVNPSFLGPELDQLDLAIVVNRGRGPSSYQRFNSADDAMAFFGDRVIDLGAIDTSSVGDLEFFLGWNFESNDPGTFFSTQMFFALIPEPQSVALLLVGLTALAAVQRSRRRG